jgi:hypothetical protein
VFLCVTGAEALYADMGHFGARPIRLAWSGLFFPSLVLNYAGQAALLLDGASATDNIFYRLCPSFLLVPLIVLATVATIIASQSIITRALSMTRQAIQLGWLPLLKITQTSAEGYGQIYVGIVNWLLMLVTLGLAVGFGKSDNLAAAYGITVSGTMLITSVLLFIAMHEIWGWSLVAAGAVAGAFVTVDASFFTANESGLRRVYAARFGGVRLRHNAHLASRSHCGLRPASRAGGARRGLHGGDRGRANPPRDRRGSIPDADPAGRAASHGLAPQTQPRPARAPVGPDGQHGADTVGPEF